MTDAPAPLLRVAGAVRRFGDRTALAGADLELRAGEWLGLLGPNGAGKTTLIRSLTGRTPLDAGTIELDGTPLPPSLRRRRRELFSRIGLVPQDFAIYPLLTARENLEVFARVHGLSRDVATRRVEWALSFTALDDRAGDVVQHFSGGMKRRLNIACGVLHRPGIVLLDEPTVGVDPQSRERIWSMLAELRDDGAALLLTTHQLDEAQQVCDRIVVIDHGRTIARGTVDELVRDTVGPERLVRLTISVPQAGRLAALQDHLRDALRCAVLDREPDPAPGTTRPSADRAAAAPRVLVAERRMDAVARELPELLEAIATAGARVDDVSVNAPTLQSVFLHLTGRELRE